MKEFILNLSAICSYIYINISKYELTHLVKGKIKLAYKIRPSCMLCIRDILKTKWFRKRRKAIPGKYKSKQRSDSDPDIRHLRTEAKTHLMW